MHLISAADHLTRFAGLATHVYGEHLGQWQEGIALLASLPALAASDAESANDTAVARGIATLRYAKGEPDALHALAPEERIGVLAIAASALCTRGDVARALAAYDEATQLAADGLPEGSSAFRALAVAGNNLAADLEVKSNRTPSETAGMVRAAQSALKFWKISGTWLQEERAEYRLARSQLQAGSGIDAVVSGRRCVDVCVRNNAPALELFFAYAVLALAQHATGNAESTNASRATALENYRDVAPEQQAWCARDLQDLQAIAVSGTATS